MKKVLLGTSALAVAALIGGQAAAAEAPSIQISGALDYHVNSVDRDPANSSAVYLNSQQYWSEIAFRGEGKTDGGTSYAAEIQWRPINMSIDEAFLTFGDSWGTVVLGDEDGPMSSGELFGFSVLPIGGQDAGPYDFANGNVDIVGEAFDSSKIIYKTPNMGGVTLAASYTPDTSDTFGNTTYGTDAAPSGGYVDHIEVGLNYSGNFGGVGVGAHIGAAAGDHDNDALEAANPMQLGAKVSMSGFSFAVGYADQGEGGCTKGSTCDQGSFTDVGVAYSMDALSFGLGYHMGESEVVAGTEVERTGTYLEMSYGVAEGWMAYAGFGSVENETAVAGGATTTVDETSFVLGTRISF